MTEQALEAVKQQLCGSCSLHSSFSIYTFWVPGTFDRH
jgi:hypothetical protein